MIGIVDYRMGNIKSIASMLRKIGAISKIVTDPGELYKAEKIILPGVGAFDEGIRCLKQFGFWHVLNELVMQGKVPVLGICLGMQLFGISSEEGKSKGLGWIPCHIEKFNFSRRKDHDLLKIPHMGWNYVIPEKDHYLFHYVPDPMRFYFVHSYHYVCHEDEYVLASTNYGYNFISVIARDNIMGVQFHPEKSHKYGLNLLKSFVEFP